MHFASCPDFGREGGDCRGCVPVAARDGAMICDRCYRSLRRYLDETPDLLGHLRSIADPTKATRYSSERVSSSRVDLPAPVAADLLDASNDIMLMLREWALEIQFPGQGWFVHGLEAGVDGEDVHDDARGCVDVILEDYDRLVNRKEIANLADVVLVRHAEDRPFWSVADASVKWPLDDRPRWAANPCPECDMRMVRVVPSRGRIRFVCQHCDWTGDSRDLFIAETFAEVRVFDTSAPTVSPERLAAFVERVRAS
ncbi:MAG: MPMin1 gp24 [Microbacterium sp.]|jgi:hypothetical protein|nr:MPMin1 gp24 [Microbacterium sp.]